MVFPKKKENLGISVLLLKAQDPLLCTAGSQRQASEKQQVSRARCVNVSVRVSSLMYVCISQLLVKLVTLCSVCSILVGVCCADARGARSHPVNPLKLSVA
jgi:hypothetical protein